MLQINKLLFILALSQFMFACDDITPEPLISSPDRELIDSVLVSAQVATGETVTYTFPVQDGNFYDIKVKRADGSNPLVLVCETVNCTSSAGMTFAEANTAFDGTITWYTATTTYPTLYIYVGDISGAGDESQYSITARIAPTNTEGAPLSSNNTYGVVNLAEEARYILAVAAGVEYDIVVTPLNGNAVTASACTDESNCAGTTVDISTTYTAGITETLFISVKNDVTTNKSLFHINATTP